MGKPARDRVTCSLCGQTFWIFADEALHCPLCGITASGVDVAAYIDASNVPDLLEQLTSAPQIDLTGIELPPQIVRLLPEELARTYTMLPVACHHDVLTIAVTSDTAIDLLEKLRFVLNRELRIVTASADGILAAIDRFYGTR